jgi:hypothetical protein
MRASLAAMRLRSLVAEFVKAQHRGRNPWLGTDVHTESKIHFSGEMSDDGEIGEPIRHAASST